MNLVERKRRIRVVDHGDVRRQQAVPGRLSSGWSGNIARAKAYLLPPPEATARRQLSEINVTIRKRIRTPRISVLRVYSPSPLESGVLLPNLDAHGNGAAMRCGSAEQQLAGTILGELKRRNVLRSPASTS